MRVKLKNILCILIFITILISIMPKTQAVGLVISFSNSKPNVGDTVTVTVTGQGIAGRTDLTVSGPATLSANSVWVDNNSATVTANITGEGSIRITATPTSMADSITSAEYTQPTAGTISVASNSSGSSTSSRTSESSSSSSNSSTEKSSNANLKNLGIRPNDFSGFTPNTTTYNTTVPEDVESVEVYATASNSKATISGTGTKTLNKGANALNVVVTAEDGTTKTYTINVTREGTEEQQTEENTEVKNGLSNITIADLELNPSFQTDVYEYTVDYVGEGTSLDLQAVATDPDYTVEVLGNEDLKEGENIITILVTDSEGNNVATYQVTVNKSLVDEEALAKEQEEQQKEQQRRMIMIAGGIIALILIIVIIIVIKRRRNRAYVEEFSGVPFSGMNDDNDNYFDYNNNLQNNDYYNNDEYNKEDIQLNNDSNNNLDKINPINNDTTNNILDDVNPANSDTMNNSLNTGDSTTSNIENMNSNNDITDNKDVENKVNNDVINTRNIDNQELLEKERAKKEFLNGYNFDNSDYYEEEKPKRGRKKGKRFK